MGNSVKGTSEPRIGNGTLASAENNAVKDQERLKTNKSSTPENRQCSGNTSSNRRSTDNENNQPNKVDGETNNKRMGNMIKNEMKDGDKIARVNENNSENDKQQQQTSHHIMTSSKLKQEEYKTPVLSKSPDYVKTIPQTAQLLKRPYTNTDRLKSTTSKLKTFRSFSEPLSKSHNGDLSKLDPAQVEYLEGNEDSLLDSELIMDMEESELDFGSSVGSVSLDSSLFESQNTIETHTTIELLSTASIIFRENKKKLKVGLLDYYTSVGFNIPEFPLLPSTDNPEKPTRYLPPWMTVTKRYNKENEVRSELSEQIDNFDTFDMSNYEYETDINQFSNIFKPDGRDMKNIYIVGDSGTGKTTFCRYLIHKWCIQHQSKEISASSKDSMSSSFKKTYASTDTSTSSNHARYVGSRKSVLFGNEFDTHIDFYSGSMSHDIFSDTYMLDKYEFLFYIPLFYETNHESILQIIDTQFKHVLNNLRQEAKSQNPKPLSTPRISFLGELFEKESEKCLIVIDGFDQWRKSRNKLSKPFLPIRDPSRKYTVIVTSTAKHLEAVEIESTPDDLEVTLNGINDSTSNIMIDGLIDKLNKTCRLRKRPSHFIKELNSWENASFKRFPFLLQSIVYLWYHAGTIGNTECDIYSRILELQFKAMNDHVHLERNKSNRNKFVQPGTPFNTADKIVKLPRYFINLANCQYYKEIISHLGKVALTIRNQCLNGFDYSTLAVYGFTQVEISNLIKVGILTQNIVPGFSPVRHSRNVFFCDKSMQEFLASTYLVQLIQNTAYENIGQIYIHADKMLSVLKSEFDVFSTFEKMFEFSNMITYICGLYPPTTEEITHMIFDAVKRDHRVIEFRQSLETESKDDVNIEMQNLISRCARESLSVNTNKMLLYIGDISYRWFDPIHVKYIPISAIKSLLINADEEPLVSSNVSIFIQETRISSGLQKLIVKDENARFSLEDIDSLHILTQCCLKTLNALSYVFNYKRRIIYLKITQDLHNILPKMSNLMELELKGIKLSHIEFSTLALTLSGLTRLRRLHLFDITCEMQRCDCEEHKMDFLPCNKLEHIEVDGRQLPIIGVSKEMLRTCNLGNLPQGAEIQIFSSLQHAKALKHFIQKVRRRPSFISQTLIKSLNTWHNVETVYLKGINFGENEFIIDAKMKNLRKIKLVETCIGRISWSHFIDSLRKLPQLITVVTRDIIVSLIEEDITRDPLRRPVDAETRALIIARETEREEAFNLVIKKSDSFKVLFYMDHMFDFEKTAK